MIKNNSIEKEIKACDVVSFDIFDTLIKRDVPSPSDVFDLVYSKFTGEKFYRNTKFRYIREKAERDAREKLDKKDININDIYNFMETEFSNDDRKKLCSLEQKIELNICKKNIDIVKMFNLVKDLKKELIITTDMYLPKNVIRDILEENGFIGYNEIFLSNDLNASKADGSIFDLVNKKYHGKKIIHIGDNFKSDVVNARKHGIKGLYWKKINNKLSYDHDINNYISNFINNRIPEHSSYYYKFGYECMGPLLLSFSKWINKSANSNGLHDIFFLARDGRIMKRAYDSLFKSDNKISTHYLLASRHSYIVPSLHKYKNVEEAFSKMFISNFITLRYLMKKLNVSVNEIDEDLLNTVDIDYIYDNLNAMLEDRNAKEFLDTIFKISCNKSINDDYNMNKYFEENNFSGKVGIIDIGWFGNMQNALLKITNNENIFGYYLGVNSKSPYKGKQHMHGFLFDGLEKNENEIYVRTFAGILELLFTRYDLGSFKGFIRENDKLVPKYGENKYSNEFSKLTLKMIQDAAIKFIEDFKNSYLYDLIDIDMNEGFKRMKRFGTSPVRKDVHMFKKIHKNNEKKLEFIDKHSAITYVLHPKKFNNDLQSSWFSAYIYNTFKVKLPIAKIYKFLKMKG